MKRRGLTLLAYAGKVDHRAVYRVGSARIVGDPAVRQVSNSGIASVDFE